MNTCIVCLGEDNSNNFIKYNHCGEYYIHRDCFKKWPHNECIICREKIVTINNSNEDINFKCKLLIAMTALCPIVSTCIIVILLI